MQSFSIVLFGYNESKSINKVFNDTLDVLSKITKDYEIIIIDDGSTDNSKDIIKKIISNNTFVYSIFNKVNLGIGQTLLIGYASSKKENICCIPLDGQFNPKELLKLNEISFFNNNFISFYRVTHLNYSFFRKILTKINFLLNFYILRISIKDVNWVKVYKKIHFDKIKFSLNSSLIESEICAKLIIKGYKPIEIESIYLPREHGKSKINTYKILSKALFEIPKLIINIFILRTQKLITRK